MLKDVVASNAGKRRTVDHFEDAAFPTNCPGNEQAFESLVGVHRGHAECIGEMLLGERKLNGSVLDQARFLRAREQVQQQIGGEPAGAFLPSIAY
jgi:hypothetical protein